MACAYKTPRFLHFFIVFVVISCSFSDSVAANRELDEDNWNQILEGEWMVEFYAPWCPACTALAPAWKELSAQATKKKMKLQAAAVDVTKSPGLSGRFVVTALPTIFHVKDAEFRQYKGPRDADSMLSFVEQERWKTVDPVPGWKAPNSIQMSLVAQFFKLSQVLRGVHNMLMEQYGLPSWGSYLIFAIATIFIGALLGLVLVCLIDLVYSPKRGKLQVTPDEAERARLLRRGEDERDLINDDIVDDKDSDAEKNSPPDTSEDEDNKKDSADRESETEGAGDAGAGAGAGARGGDVRRRRPRKDD